MKSIKDWQRPEQEKLDKLPKWARSYVELLEMRLAEQEWLVDQVSGEGVEHVDLDDSKVYVQTKGDEIYREIHKDSRIQFPLGDDNTAEVRLDRTGRGGIQVMTSGGPIGVLPQVSNVVRIVTLDRNA